MHKIIYSLIFIVMMVTIAGCQEQQGAAKTNTKDKISQNKNLTQTDKDKLKKMITNQVAAYAKEQKLAVTNRYVSNGRYSESDFYATTTDGEIQVIDNNKPGAKHFKLHNVTGLTVYTSETGNIGLDDSAKQLSNIEGYKSVANMNRPIKKYLFADNGKVYEYNFKGGSDATLSSGFAYKDSNDKDPNLKPNVIFKETENDTIRKKWSNVFRKYE
ncbi:hypothetical protein MHZ36_06380 [Staphylococcus sp. ACRSN]|uniref:hypothetical protein n=1 Tax=Staphylococcus sp. ACRSN TaxID=2918214 RepID=UPI001EF3CBC6|nr:hypothetical protein [Staphylococcus sp. ACRSN]MCG7338913.1 hypothetical protein [Staphylococcus sp. ACRSN]